MGESYQPRCILCSEMIHMFNLNGSWGAFNFPMILEEWELHYHRGGL